GTGRRGDAVSLPVSVSPHPPVSVSPHPPVSVSPHPPVSVSSSFILHPAVCGRLFFDDPRRALGIRQHNAIEIALADRRPVRDRNSPIHPQRAVDQSA